MLMSGVSMAGEPKSAAESMKKGEQLLSAGDSDGAVAAYTEAIRLDPKDHERSRCTASQKMNRAISTREKVFTTAARMPIRW
jgi:predicted TPR repeat methyltransferase